MTFEEHLDRQLGRTPKKDRVTAVYYLTDCDIEHHINPEKISDEEFANIGRLVNEAVNEDSQIDEIIYRIIEDAVEAVKGGPQ